MADAGNDYPEMFGAKGNGVADDTVAVRSAIAQGRRFKAKPGATYLVDGGIAQTVNGQTLDFTDAKVKLKDNASTKGILTIGGKSARVVGGDWDGNARNNASGDQFEGFAVNLTADDASCEGASVHDFHGLGIKGAGAHRLLVTRNTVSRCGLTGIYVEGVGRDYSGVEISFNRVVISDTAARGIYLTGENSPFTNKQRAWRVIFNSVSGPATGTGVAITVRGVEGVYTGNEVTGFLLQHSLDITTDSVISGNRGTAPATGGESYGVEVNGGGNAIAGNYMRGHYYGIACTGRNADRNVISGNQILDFLFHGVHVAPGTTRTAKNWLLTGNQFTSTGSVPNRVGAFFQGDCDFVEASNMFGGAGSGWLDTKLVP